MNKRRKNKSASIRPAFVCGALLFFTTIVIAQHALDANLRVGSGGYNRARTPQATMNRSPYTIASSGDIVYNRAAAFNDTAYMRPTVRHQRSIGNYDPKPVGRASVNAASLARPSYSAGRSARPSTGQRQIVRSVNRTSPSATMQRGGYKPGRSAVSAMQAPTLNMSQRPYSASGVASSTIRSR